MDKGEAVPFILIEENRNNQNVDYSFKIHPRAHEVFNSEAVKNKKVDCFLSRSPLLQLQGLKEQENHSCQTDCWKEWMGSPSDPVPCPVQKDFGSGESLSKSAKTLSSLLWILKDWTQCVNEILFRKRCQCWYEDLFTFDLVIFCFYLQFVRFFVNAESDTLMNEHLKICPMFWE